MTRQLATLLALMALGLAVELALTLARLSTGEGLAGAVARWGGG